MFPRISLKNGLHPRFLWNSFERVPWQTPERQTPERQTPKRQIPERQTPERQTPENTNYWNYVIFLWMKYDKIHKLSEKKYANILEKILNL